MSKQASKQHPAPVMLSVNAIIGGVFHSDGSALPFKNESDLPAALQPFVATGEEPSIQPPVRNIYDFMSPPLRRQAARRQAIAQEKDWAKR